MCNMDYNWADCSMCDVKDKRIEELERQKELLEGALEFEKERANGLAEEVEQHELKAENFWDDYAESAMRELEIQLRRAMSIEDIKARHKASQQSTDIPANEEFWQCLEDRGWLLEEVESAYHDIRQYQEIDQINLAQIKELEALGDEFDMMHEMVHSRYVAERIYAILEDLEADEDDSDFDK